MANADYVQNALQGIDAARAAALLLPADGPIRAVLSGAYFDEHRSWASASSDIENALWPPLLAWVMMRSHTLEELRLLDADIKAIRDHPSSSPEAAVRWLSASNTEGRVWRGGLFETSMKARALGYAESTDNSSVAFDVPLPNGRNVDIVLTLGDRSYFLECTVITESVEDEEVHAAWMEARKEEPGLLLGRPGRFDPPNSKGPSPYYETNRFYIKVFDKLQKNGDPARTQTSDHNPNVMLLSCFPIFGSPLPFSPSLGWAMDELFDGQPNMGAVKVLPPQSSLPDISL